MTRTTRTTLTRTTRATRTTTTRRRMPRAGVAAPFGAAGVAVIGASLLLVGCGGAELDDGPDVPADPSWTIAAGGSVDPQLADAVADVAAEYDGQAAIALALPGAESGGGPVVAGELHDAFAWSTSKVPVAIAALRGSGGEPSVTGLIEPMISESDNDAAELAWLSLGDEEEATAAVNEVLGDGGDARTRFEPGLPPGDVEWELADQAAFGANLACIDGAGPVVAAMGEIVDYQSYGLGEIQGAHFKGGWGPDDDGTYLSRQFGVIPASGGGYIGVAIAARPGDATDDTGRAMLDDIARALMVRMPHGGDCASAPVTSTRAR